MSDNSLETVIEDNVLVKSIISYLDNSVPCEEKDVTLLKKSMGLGTVTGENYTSAVYQAQVSYLIGDDPTEYDVRFIIKHIPNDDSVSTLSNESQVFEKEKMIYEKVLPGLESISRITFAPKCFYSQETPHKLIVLSDLRPLGYSIRDRKAGLDFDHCKLVVQRLAAYHASSMKFAAENGPLVESFSTGLATDKILVEVIYRPNLEKLIATAEHWAEPEFVKIVGHLKKILSNYEDVYKMPMNTSSDEFRVLCHGDVWVNNFMFAYDEEGGPPKDVLFLDHQMPLYASPGYDLNYFLVGSPSLEVRFNHEKELLAIYQKAFNEKLKELDFPFQLSEEKLERALKQKAVFGFVIMLTLMPLILRTVREGGDFEDKLLTIQNMRNDLFADDGFVSILKFSLRKWLMMGVFETICN